MGKRISVVTAIGTDVITEASQLPITDAGEHYDSSTVEGALEEVGAQLSAVDTQLAEKANQADLTALDTRVDTIITTPVDGVSAQEIIDARQGAATLGANIEALKADIMPISDQFVPGKNLFNYRTATSSYLVNQNDGDLDANAIYTASDYIAVSPSSSYTIREYGVGVRVAYYNSSKVFISGALNPGSTITTPSECAFLRFSFLTSGVMSQQLEVGPVSTDFEAYGKYLSAFRNESIPISTLAGKIGIANTDFVVLGKNLFDYTTVTANKYVRHTDGTLGSNTDYYASDYISVEPDTAYTNSKGLYTAFYTTNKSFISGFHDPDTAPKTFTTPANAAYMRVSIPKGFPLSQYQVEVGSTATAYEPFGYRLIRQLPIQRGLIPEITLPSKLYAIVGQELNIYFDNIMNDRADKYDIDVACEIGMQYKDCFRVTPDDDGEYAITISAYLDGIELARATSSIIVTEATVGDGVTKSVLVIGDSTTANGIAVSKLTVNFDDDVMSVTMLGARGTAPNNHEGISGWTANYFRTMAQDATSSVNNFYNPSTSAFDFSYYMAQRGYTGVDYVVINLGINDVFSRADDDALLIKIASVLDDYDFFIDSIHVYNANIKIGIALTIPPNISQDAFGKAYTCEQTRWRYKRNNYMLVKALIGRYDGREAEGIYLVPINTNLDTRYNMGFEVVAANARNTAITLQEPIANGGVHPVESGYWQIADVYWYWLKSLES